MTHVNHGPLPKSDRNDELEELSLQAFTNAFPVDQFRVRGEPGKDRGVDRYLEIKATGHDTNFRSQVQLKSMEKASPNADGSVSKSIETSNFNYMLNGPPGILPAYPLRVACAALPDGPTQHISDDALLAGMGEFAAVFYNNTNDKKCFEAGVTNEHWDLDGLLWNYLYCSSVIMPMGQDGKHDMFWNAPFDLNETVSGCEKLGFKPDPLWVPTAFGDTPAKYGDKYSNIVWSNGALDPWIGGGITQNISDSLVAIIIPDVGHHIDLMFSNKEDTAEVKFAREFERRHIQKWIDEHNANRPEEPAMIIRW